MKKFLSFVMVLMFVFSLGVTAFATENTGSITITNATINETYAIYKILDASIKLAADGETAEAVAYSIQTSNQFFEALFGADGTAANTYFTYNADTGSVTKNEGVNDANLIKYLTDLVKNGSFDEEGEPVKATSDVVEFDGIPYGYYLITSTLGTTVTINSNTPDVEVIDKNQKPAPDFEKKIQNGVDEDGNPIWVDENSANIGDEITYKISFTATNYDGDKQIKYYQIHDTKGEAIWTEFYSIRVFVGGEELTKGYYLSEGGINTDNWEFLGTWEGVEEDARDAADAEWYLVHLGYDEFRISIPWLEGHTVTETEQGDVTLHSFVFPEGAESKFDSPVTVEVYYDSVIEPGAVIGGAITNDNRYNEAYTTWTSEFETGSSSRDKVMTYVYGIGILKDDIATGANLAGAKFRVYKDEDCTIPVYVIPTDVAGVYMVDSLNTPSEVVSGDHKFTAREVYAAYLADYLGTNTQDNYVVSQANGKLVILGLEEGTYYLKEVEAPSGYNALTAPVELKAGEDLRSFSIFADENGNVADIQNPDGVHTEIKYELTSTVVHNSKGVQLPSTGGIGTFWLITIGSLVAIGFAVFLITHKKMSVYND